MTPTRVVVVGGGIGGLTTAVALQHAGLETVVVERAPSVQDAAVGAGIHLWSNAVRSLQMIGAADDVAAVGTPVSFHRYVTWRGRSLGSLHVEAISADLGAPTVGLSRSELHSALLGRLGGDVVRSGAECIGFEQNTQHAWAQLADGTRERGDALIGADGVRSVVRRQLHGPVQPRYSGLTAWRAICDYADPRMPVGEMVIYWGPGARILHYHVSDSRLYWLALVKAPPRGEDPAGGRRAVVQKRFRGFPAQVQAMIAATAEEAVLRTDIVDRDPLKHWGKGRVTLLGDAAHPMTPDMAQGAGQAMEDAVSLAQALAHASDPVDGLRDYEARRMSRANGTVKTSRVVSKMGLMDSPVACAFRNQLVLRTVYALQQSGQARKNLIPAV